MLDTNLHGFLQCHDVPPSDVVGWAERPKVAGAVIEAVVTSSPRAKPVTDPFEASFPKRFQGVFHHGLDTAIDNGGNAKRPFPVPLGDIDPTDGVNLVEIEGAELVAQRLAL